MNIIDTSAAAIKPNNAGAVSFSREITRVDIGKYAGPRIGIPGSPAYTLANEARS